MIVEYRWKSVGPACKVHSLDTPRGCFFCWVPSIEQAELLDGIEDFSYLDKVVSVSGLDEDEDSSFSDQSLLNQLSLFREVGEHADA